MRAAELVKKADLLLKTERYEQAIPFLQSYLKKFGDINDVRIILMSQDMRLKLARILAKTGDAAGAAVYLEQYVSWRPAPKWHDAMKLLSLSLLEAGRNPPQPEAGETDLSQPEAEKIDPAKLERCIEVTLAALAGPTNEINPIVEEPVVDEEEKEPEVKLNEFGEIITGDEAAAEELDSSGYKRSDIVILNFTLAEAYDKLGKLQESIQPYLYVSEHEKVAVQRGYAIMKAIEAMVKLQQFEELTRLIPPLYQTEARFDIRVNLGILSAASSLFEAERYDEALLLYRMILPRDKLIKFQNKRIKRMQYDAGLITLNDLTREEAVELGIDVTLFGKKTKLVTEEIWYERGNEDSLKSKELLDLEQLVDMLKTLAPYESEVKFRSAYLYDVVDRPWEAVEVFNQMWEEDPESDIGQRAFYEGNRVLFEKLEPDEEDIQRCYEYLDNYKSGLVPRQIAYVLTGYYQRTSQMPSVKKLLPYLEGFLVAADPTARLYEVELYYMQAIADLVMLEYENALASFELVMERYPESAQQDNCTYWHAMTQMFLEEFEKAYAEFESYLEKFPEGTWVASANFQLGTCMFGMEEYDKAKERFTTVIEQYPGSNPYPDACSMRGDILASEEGETKLDQAIADYQEAVRAAKAVYEDAPARSVKQATYATFQMTSVYDALASAYKDKRDEYYEKIISVVNEYLDFYGASANISKGIYWIGRTRISQGRVDEAIQSYLEAIAEYGNNLKQDGVDSMIAELVGVSRRMKTEQYDQLVSSAEVALQKAEGLKLQLRLRALIARLSGTEMELGKQLISELDDLSVAAPPVLAAISKASFEENNYSRAGEILKVFKDQFNDSEFIRPAYKLRAFDLHKSGELDEAMAIIKETQERYGWDLSVSWAQLMKGDILIQQRKYEEAREQLLAVFNLTAWRGTPYAEATYRLGQAEEAAGNLSKAFGWYQRAYFQYKGYANGYWAAEAYLASARCLRQMGLLNEERNTYRAMLFDKYVNKLPQADVARQALGPDEVLEIIGMITSGTATNVTVTIDQEAGE